MGSQLLIDREVTTDSAFVKAVFGLFDKKLSE
jgi:hypothetical protein